jgi:hypothetical protein
MMTDPVIKPEHRELAVKLLEGALYPLDAVQGVESIAQALADLEATVEARVRLEQTQDAQRYRELVSALECIRRESLGSMLSKTMWPDDGHSGTPVVASLLALAESLGWKPCPGAKEEQGGK